jgi:hypothetical protein
LARSQRCDVVLELWGSTVDTSADSVDELGHGQFAVDELPDDEPDRVRPVVRARLDMQQHPSFPLGQLTRNHVGVSSNLRVPVHRRHHCARKA